MRWNICFKATNQTSNFSPDFSNPHYLIFSNKALFRREKPAINEQQGLFQWTSQPSILFNYFTFIVQKLDKFSVFFNIYFYLDKKCKKQDAEEISRIHRKLENEISTQLNFISHTAVNPESAKRFRIRQTTNYPAENAFNRNRDQRI